MPQPLPLYWSAIVRSVQYVSLASWRDNIRPGLKGLHVQAASLSHINGIYVPTSTFDGVPKYTRRTIYKGRDRILTLFRCLVKGNSKRWYISIVPSSLAPGTIHDTDFYTAPASSSSLDFVPPTNGWVVVGEGRGIAPTVHVVQDLDDEDEEENTTTFSTDEDDTNEESKDDDEETRSSDDDGERDGCTPKASGSTRKTLKWNPLGILKDSEKRLTGLNAEIIQLPPLVTVNGQEFKEDE